MDGGKLLGILILLQVLVAPVSGQVQSDMLDELRDAYRQFEYDAAERLAALILDESTAYPPEMLAEVHTTLALIAYAQFDQGEARRQFEAALSLDSTLELDPLMVSPKILSFFEEVRKEYAAYQEQSTDPRESIRYLLIEDPRPAAAMRSMVVPGWGQVYKGERRKGWLIVGAWGTLATATVTAHALRNRAQDRYLDASTPGRIEREYDAFNTWHKVRNNLALATLGVWAYGYIDALVVPPDPAARSGPNRAAVAVVPSPDASAVSFALQLTF